MSAPLDGITVVVTRPAAQAGGFLAMARGAGAQCIEYPTLEIEQLAVAASTRMAMIGSRWDWAIYTSSNAVQAAFEQLDAVPARRHAAVGRATARALEQRGIVPDLRPESANSEGLLALPELQSVAGRQVLLLKGAGGRDLLRATLEARGARVETVELYRRRRAIPNSEATQALRTALAREGGRLVVAVTSAEVLDALLQGAPTDALARLRASPLLVPGARVAAAAAAARWTGPLVQAATAEDRAMLDALVAWAAGPPAPA